MKLFARDIPKPVQERRTTPRTRVDCMAIMVLPSGNVPGRLFDISDTGARITADNPPGKGCALILEWPYGEAYGKITWSKPGMCGVQFDRPLHPKMLEETIESAPSGPRLVHSADTGPEAMGEAAKALPARPRLFC